MSWHEVGSLRLASTKERFEELQRQAGWAKTFGLPLELITAEEAQAKFPLMTLDGVLGAVWLPTDGWLDPSGLAQALAAGARSRGAQIRQHTRVVGINVAGGSRHAAWTSRRRTASRETIEAEVVVNAGGMYAPEIGRLAGVTVPIIPMAHQYLFTERHRGRRPDLPTMRDPDRLCYFREEVGGLCMGGYERDPMPWSLDGIPRDFNHRLLDPDWPRFESIMEGAISRVPAIENAGVTRMINGPEAFTPDNEFILGESEVRGFFVAAGFCAHGIAGTGGIGKQMAHWIVDGEPELDLWKMDIRRFGGQYRSQSLTLARTYENYATYYDIHYPNEERHGRPAAPALAGVRGRRGAGRGLRREVHVGAPELVHAQRGRRGRGVARGPGGAPPARLGGPALVAGDRGGGAGDAPDRRRSSTSPASPRSRSRGQARSGSCSASARTTSTGPSGSITYTQMLNRRGGIECDFTVTRLATDRFLIVTGTAFGNHDLGWIRSPAPARGLAADVRVRDVTSARACFGIWGPAGARHPPAAHEGRPLERGVPVPDRPRDHDRRRAGPRAAGHLRRRARAGSCTARRSTGARCGDRSGRRAASMAWSRAATAPSTRCASRRATASGRATSRPRRRRTRPVSGSR